MIALLALVAVIGALMWIDRARGGPATNLSRCNLALARADKPPANVLLIGSSRSGVAFDPVAIQGRLQTDLRSDLTVDRIAMGNITLRVSDALLETYLQRRGAPDVVVLEPTFITPRTVARLAPAANGTPSEHYLLTRDLNLMSFGQLLTQPSVAMPYTEPEALSALWQFRLRGAVSRAGALAYQFAKAPFDSWSIEDCERADFAREASWPADFSFAYDDYRIEGPLPDFIFGLRAELEEGAATRDLQDWQTSQPVGRSYPYDFQAGYRQGEMRYFLDMVERALAVGAHVLVVPMPLYGYRIDPAALEYLVKLLPDGVEVLEIYDQIGTDFSTYWYDDAHIEKFPTGVLTTALLSARLETLIEVMAQRD
ncbi:hypothetical protein ACFQ3C_15405 [Seohaeicola saemankumensis]|uniref:Uncharacterized protein n=1 Tax=Seohaeicola saemankumensis TaxID=481181 RepID=A0ABW3TH65_9RHOB